MRRKPGGGGAKLVVGILVGAAAVVGGAVFLALREDLFPRKKPPRRAVGRKPPERKIVRPAVIAEKPVEIIRPPKVVTPPALAEDEERARNVLTLAASAMKECDFSRAASLYSSVGSMSVSKRAAHDARAGAVKAAVFRDVLEGVKLNPEATGQLKRFVLDGTSLEAVLVRETNDSYVVRKDKGITVPLPKAEVYRVEDISEAKKKEKLFAQLDRRKKELASKPEVSPALRSCLVAEFAYRNRLTDEAYPALEEAYSHDPNLKAVALEYRAGKLFAHAIWYESKDDPGSARLYCKRIQDDYPNTRRARDAQELLAGMDARARKKTYRSTVRVVQREEEAPARVEVSMVSSDREANAPVVARANRLFEQAMKEYIQGRPGRPRFNEHLRRSVPLFDSARDLYQQALRNDPGNTTLENRATDCQRYGYNARKMQTISVF